MCVCIHVHTHTDEYESTAGRVIYLSHKQVVRVPVHVEGAHVQASDAVDVGNLEAARSHVLGSAFCTQVCKYANEDKAYL